MSRKVLITGAEGFIGSHLVEELVHQGHQVKAFCLYNSFNNIGWLNDINPKVLESVEIVMGDVRDVDSIKSASKGVDVIFHLAALIAIPYSYRAPQSYIDTNVTGTLNVMRAALEAGVSQVIHTSTSEVYGTAQFVPITEAHPLVGQSPYSASKIGADQIAYSFFCSFGLPVSTVRPFNTYGPRQSLRAVIPTIILQALMGKDVIKLGNVDATRDFNFVSDTAKGMVAFLDNASTFGRVINLGTGTEVTVRHVVESIARITGCELTIEVDEQRIRPENSEVERLCASNDLAREVLGWSPQYPLQKGLEITLDWLRVNQEKYGKAEAYTV